MGYNTFYSLRLEPENLELIDQLRSENPELEMAIEDDGSSKEGTKWYEWEEDMRKISSQHPDYLFHLGGEGDENNDIWAATFKNGKAHIRDAEIVIPPFDESKLE